MIAFKWIGGIATMFVFTLCFAHQVGAGPSSDSCQRLILTLLTPHMNAQIQNYYRDKLTEAPIVAPFLGGNRLEYQTFDSYTDVVVTIIPYVGPHIDVGEDRIKFRVDHTGKVATLKYEHIRDCKLPPHWTRILKDQANGER